MSDKGYFALPKKALEEAMKLLDAVPTRNGISSSEYIKADLRDKKHIKMSLTSELGGMAILPVAKEGNIKSLLYLDRRMLKPFVQAGMEFHKSDIYEFFVEGNSIKIKHGPRNAILESSSDATGYDDIPIIKKGLSIELKEEWTSITNCATLCACSDPIAPAYNCVHIQPKEDKIYVRASDTKLLFQGVLPKKAFPCKLSVALPLELSDNLTLFGSGICHYSDKWAMLQFQIGYLWQGVKSECRKSFPANTLAGIVSAVVRDGSVVSVIGTASLVDAAERISNYMNAAMKDNPALTLVITAGKKKARLCSNTIGAEFDEMITLEKPADKDYKVEWSLSAVLPVFQYCKNAGSAKIIQDTDGKICFKAGRVILISNKKKQQKKGK